MKTFLVSIIGVVGLFVAATAVMFVFKTCPPQGPWPTPPWCIQQPIDFNLTVTVPYWTEGDVYLGVGNNASYLKLNHLESVFYSGTAKIGKGEQYYYSRGSLATRSWTISRQWAPNGLDAVTDWIDSTKPSQCRRRKVLVGGSGWHPEEA